MDLSFLQGNGWVGVALGLVMFGMGYIKGKSIRREFVGYVIDATIQRMVKDGFVKTSMLPDEETGEMTQHILRYDEE